MIIGRVSLLIGKALAIKPDGSSRELTLGDNVESDELISVSAGGKVVIALTIGESISVGENDTWIQPATSSSLSEAVSTTADGQLEIDNEKSIIENDQSDIDPNSAQAIQAALLAGVDVTGTAEATAAGAGNGAEGEGQNEGSSFVMIKRGGEVSIDAGFDFNTIVENGSDVVFSSRETQRIESPLITLFSAFDNVGEQDSINPELIISNSSTDDNQPTIAGTDGTPGATINIYDLGLLVASTSVNLDGSWNIEIPTPLDDNEHSITVTQQIDGFVESNPSLPLIFSVDTQVPADLGPVTVTDDVGLEQGQLVDGASTDDETPTISGIGAAPGDVIEIIDNGIVIGTVTVEVDGSWSHTPTDPLSEGEHSFTARAVDPAGNVGNETLAVTVIIDVSVPTANINITAITEDKGDSDSDFITSDTSLTVTGTLSQVLVAGDIVQVSNDGGTTWVDAAVSGTRWSLVDGDINGTDFSYTVRVIDTAGNVGSSDSQAVVIDNNVPSAAIKITAISEDRGDSDSDFITSDNSLTVSGILSEALIAGDTVQVSNDGGTTWVDAIVSGTRWSLVDVAIHYTDFSYTARVIDTAGNVGSSVSQALVIDNTAPTANISIAAISDDTGESDSDFITSDTSITVSGTLSEALADGESVQVSNDGENWVEAIVSGTRWSLVDGDIHNSDVSYTARVVDSAGNVGSRASQEVVIDNNAPTAVIGITAISDDTGESDSDFITSDTSLTVSGTLSEVIADGESVQVSNDGGTTWVEAIVTGTRWSLVDGDIKNSDFSYTARVVDAAGNVGSSASQEVVIDNNAPTAVIGITAISDDTGESDSDFITSDISLTVSGTLSKALATGESAQVSNDGVNWVEAIVIGTRWSLVDVDTQNSDFSYSVRVIDTAGNVGSTDSQAVVIEAQKPIISTVLDNVGNTDQNVPNNSTTNDATPTIIGSASAGAVTVTLYRLVDTVRVELATDIPVSADGAWTYTPEVPLLLGDYELLVTSNDAQGLVSKQSETRGFSLAIESSDEPAIINVIDNVDHYTGNVQNNTGITNDAQPEIVGTAKAGDTVTIYDTFNGERVVLGSATSDSDGVWRLQLADDSDAATLDTLSDGIHSLSAVSNAGQTTQSTDSGVYSFKVDTLAPVVLDDVLLTDDHGSTSGAINVDNNPTDDNKPQVSGKAEPGSTVNVYVDGNSEPIAVTVDLEGKWSKTLPELKEGKHEVVTEPVDKAGNVGDRSDPVNFIVDTSVPVVSIEGAQDNQLSHSDDLNNKDLTNDATPVLFGSSTAGQVISVTSADASTDYGQTTADVTGKWSLAVTLTTEGVHNFIASVVSSNPLVESAEFELVLDSLAPDAPVIVSVQDDVGSVQDPLEDGDSTDDQTPTLVGTGEPGSTIEVFANGSKIGETHVDSKGQWTFTPPTPIAASVAPATVSFTAIAIDPAGNSSEPSPGYNIVIDITGPAIKPVIIDITDNQGNAQERVAQDANTNDATPTITGTAVDAQKVTLYRIVEGVLEELAINIPVTAGGTWEYTPKTPLLLGDYELLVISADASGNVSEQSETRSFSLAIESSDQPSIINVIDDVDQYTANVENNTGITNDAQPEIVGTAKAGDTVTVYDKLNEERVVLGSATANSDGVWRLQLADDSDPVTVDTLVDGTHSLTAVSNVGKTTQSPESGAYRFEIDTLAPEAIDDVLLTDDQGSRTGPINVENTPSDDNKPEISGTGEPGSTVNVYVDGNPEPIKVPVELDGTWSVALPELIDGTHKIVTEPVDKAGNVGEQSDPVEFVIDSRVLNVNIQGAADDEDLYAGELNNGDVSNDIAPVLFGTATPDLVVTVVSSGVSPQIVYGSATVDAAGNWRLPVLPPHTLSDGEHVFIAQVDIGTANSESSIFTLLIDSTAPDAPAMTVLDNQGANTDAIVDGAITDDNQPQVTGTGAEAGAIIEVFLDGATESVASAVVDSNGSWSVILPLLNNGPHDVSSQQIDAAGNRSAASDISFTVDNRLLAVSITGALDNVEANTGEINSGDLTNDSTPELFGSATPGELVTVMSQGLTPQVTYGVVEANADGEWRLTITETATISALGEGLHNFVAQVTTATGTLKSSAFSLEIDTQAPDLAALTLTDDQGPIVGPIDVGTNPIAPTDDNKPEVSGTAEPGSTVNVYVDGNLEPIVVLVDPEGKWSTTLPELKDGKHQVVTEPVDEAGNVGEVSDPVLFTVDTRVLSVSIKGAEDDVSSHTENLNNNDLTNDANPVLFGTGTTGDKVTVKSVNGSIEYGTVTVDASGAWRLEVALPSDDTYDFKAEINRGAGSVSSAEFILVLDSADPDAPVIVSVQDDVGSAQGGINNGGSTDDQTPTLVGTSEANATLGIYAGDQLLGLTQAAADGTWTFTPSTPLLGKPANTVDFTAVASDAAGNSSVASATYTVTIDISVTAAPMLTSVTDDQGTVTGDVANEAVTDDRNPTFSGTGEVGDVIKVFINGDQIGSTTVTAKGTWSLEVASAETLIDGEYSVRATATNSAGTESAPTDARTFRIDGTAPAAPAITTVKDNVGNVDNSEIDVPKTTGITNDNTPKIQGTADPSKVGNTITVRVYDDGVLLGSTTVGTDGQWSFSLPLSAPLPQVIKLADGLHKISANAVNQIGVESTKTGDYPFTVDTSAPDAPTLIATDDVASGGSTTGVIGKDATTDDAQPTYSGTGEAGAVIQVFAGKVLLGTATVQANKTWTLNSTKSLTDGNQSIKAIQTDPAGNQSVDSQVLTFIVDTASVTVTISHAQDNVERGTTDVTTNGTTNDPTPVLEGTAKANALVTVTQGSEVIGSVTADASGKWTLAVVSPGSSTGLEDGTYTFVALAKDSAGSQASSGKFILTIDQENLSDIGPLIVSDDVGTVQGKVAHGETTDDETPTISGSGATPGDTIEILDAAKVIGSATVDVFGNWTFTPSKQLAKGSHSFSARPIDPSGNVGTETAVVTIVIDIEAPVAPLLTAINDDVGVAPDIGDIKADATTDDARPTIVGTAEANSLVIVMDDGLAIGSVQVNAEGDWRLEPEQPLLQGKHLITATATDAAGNTSAATTTGRTFTVDLAGASAPSIENVIDNKDPMKGNVAKGTGITNDPQPVVSGSATAGSKVTLYDTVNGEVTKLATVDTDDAGNWSYKTKLVDGEHNLTADSVLNDITSARTGVYNFVVDTAGPTAPTLIGTDDQGPEMGAIVNGTTIDDALPTFSGQGEVGATIQVMDGPDLLGTTQVDKQGNWSLTPTDPLRKGAHNVIAEQVDAAGNSGTASTALAFTVNTSTVEVSISHAIDKKAGVMGELGDNSLSNDTQPELVGTSTKGALVTVQLDGTDIGSTTADSAGNWRFDVPLVNELNDGSHTFIAHVKNAGGRVDSNHFTLLIDGTAPDQIAPLVAFDDVGSIQGQIGAAPDNNRTDDTTATLKGTGVAGDVIEIFDGVDSAGQPISLGSSTVDSSGAWEFTPSTPLTEGAHPFKAQATDAAGNTGPLSAGLPIVIDLSVPSTVTLTGVTDDQGTVKGDVANEAVTDDRNPAFSGTGEVGDVIKVYINGDHMGSTTVTAKGTWSLASTKSLVDGQYSVRATATNSVGSESAPTNARTFKVDGTAPDQVVSITSISVDSGSSAKDFITSDNTLIVNGELNAHLQSDELVKVSRDGGVTWETAVTTNSTADSPPPATWTLAAVSAQVDGTYVYQAKVVDSAGGTSVIKKQNVVIDTMAPKLDEFDNPFVDLHKDSDTMLNLDVANKGTKTDNKTLDKQPDFTGELDASYAGSSIVYYGYATQAEGDDATDSNVIRVLLDGQADATVYDKNNLFELGRTVVNGDGSWTMTMEKTRDPNYPDDTTKSAKLSSVPDSITGHKQYYLHVSAKMTDVSGNTSEMSAVLDIVIGTNPRGELTIDPLVLDLDGDGVQTTSLVSGVKFDHNNDGFRENSGWATAGDGLLVLDLNSDGIISSGRELFGDQMLLEGSEGSFAADGFAALAQYDSDTNDIIDSSDSIYSELQVWIDADGDGFSDAGELKSLSELNITEIGLDSQSVSVDQGGNTLVKKSTFTQDGTVKKTANVNFGVGPGQVVANESPIELIATSDSYTNASQVGDIDKSNSTVAIKVTIAAATLNDASLIILVNGPNGTNNFVYQVTATDNAAGFVNLYLPNSMLVLNGDYNNGDYTLSLIVTNDIGVTTQYPGEARFTLDVRTQTPSSGMIEDVDAEILTIDALVDNVSVASVLANPVAEETVADAVPPAEDIYSLLDVDVEPINSQSAAESEAAHFDWMGLASSWHDENGETDAIGDAWFANEPGSNQILDLSDLLEDEAVQLDSLNQYLHFEQSGDNLTVYIDQTGSFTEHHFDKNNASSVVTLLDTSLLSTDYQDVMKELIDNHQLIIGE